MKRGACVNVKRALLTKDDEGKITIPVHRGLLYFDLHVDV